MLKPRPLDEHDEHYQNVLEMQRSPPQLPSKQQLDALIETNAKNGLSFPSGTLPTGLVVSVMAEHGFTREKAERSASRHRGGEDRLHPKR